MAPSIQRPKPTYAAGCRRFVFRTSHPVVKEDDEKEQTTECSSPSTVQDVEEKEQPREPSSPRSVQDVVFEPVYSAKEERPVSPNSLGSGLQEMYQTIAKMEEQLTNAKLEFCSVLLRRKSLDKNKVGIELLLRLIKPKQGNTLTLGTLISRSIVFGYENNNDSASFSYLSELRNLILPFLVDDKDIGAERLLRRRKKYHIEVFFDRADEEEDDQSEIRGRYEGALHGAALEVVVTALERVSIAPADTFSIDFRSIFWKCVVDTLTHNISTDQCHAVSGQSLKCLRLLQAMEPITVNPLLQYSLLPYIYHWKEYADNQDCHMIQEETSQILTHAMII